MIQISILDDLDLDGDFRYLIIGSGISQKNHFNYKCLCKIPFYKSPFCKNVAQVEALKSQYLDANDLDL